MDVSIILVSYNTKDLTRDCLKSVYEKTQGVEFEIFVVDNNSYDGSAEMIEQEFPDVRLIRNSENKGFGAANNIAIRQCNAKYIFCLNTDTVLLNNAVKIFFDFMENSENSNVGACGGQLFDKDMNANYSVNRFIGTDRILFSMFGLKYLFPKYYKKKYALNILEQYNTITEVDAICGADLFLRKSVIDEVGMFDEDYFMYFEETDLCKRIQQAGYLVMFLPEVKIIHYAGGSTVKKKININHLKSILLYYKKNVSIFSYMLLKILLLLSYFLKLLLKKDLDAKKVLENIITI